MARLIEEAEKLSNRALERGVVSTFYQEGFKTIVQKIHFVKTQGKTYDWNVEKELAGGTSARDKASLDIGQGQPRYEQASVKTRMLALDSDTPLADIASLNDINDQRKQRDYATGKQLAFDFGLFMQNGTGQGPTPHGAAYSASLWGGFQHPDGSITTVSADNTVLAEIQLYATANGRPTHTQANWQTLSADHLDEFLTRDAGQGTHLLVATRKGRNAIKKILRAESGGTTPPMLMDKDFGQPVLAYDGVPVIYNSDVGRAKGCIAGTYGLASGAAGDGSSSTTVKVKVPANADNDQWLGFVSWDIGRQIVINGDTANPRTIVDVVDFRTAVLDTAVTCNNVGALMPAIDNLILAYNFNEDDGFVAIYNNMGDVTKGSAGYEQVDTLGGFVCKDHGETDQGRIVRTKMTWLGTMVGKGKRSVRTLSHFKMP